MSNIKLTTFTAFVDRKPGTRRNSDDSRRIDILFGAVDSRINNEGKVELLADHVPLRDGLTPPQDGLLMLYGYGDISTELPKRRAEARELNATFHFADLHVDVGDIYPGVVDRSILKQQRFVNVSRMNVALQQEILNIFSNYMKEENSDDFDDESASRLQLIAQRPDLFARLLNDDKDFKKLECIIIPVSASKFEGVTKIRNLAYLRKNCKITLIDQQSDSELIILPKGFGKMLKPGEVDFKRGRKPQQTS